MNFLHTIPLLTSLTYQYPISNLTIITIPGNPLENSKEIGAEIFSIVNLKNNMH